MMEFTLERAGANVAGFGGVGKWGGRPGSEQSNMDRKERNEDNQ